MMLEFPPELTSMLSGLVSTLAAVQSDIKEIKARSHEAKAASLEARIQYSIDEAAKMLGRSPYTVREWCRHGQINAIKLVERRGASAKWAVTSGELERYRNEGLLPIDPSRNKAH